MLHLLMHPLVLQVIVEAVAIVIKVSAHRPRARVVVCLPNHQDTCGQISGACCTYSNNEILGSMLLHLSMHQCGLGVHVLQIGAGHRIVTNPALREGGEV